MPLSLEDYEDVKAAQEAAPVASAAQEPASAASGAFVPPNNNNTTPPSGAASPNLVNQAWEGIKPYLNPVHYNAGGPQDFTNLDLTSTLIHGLGEGAVGLGLANRIKRELSGEAASARQFRRQNDLVERRITMAEANNALAEAQNVKDVEQKVAAQAAGKPAPQQRIEPTFAPEPPVAAAVPEPALAPQVEAAKLQLPQATISGQQQPQMQYGQTTINQPTGAPNVLPTAAAAPPAEANAPVAPKLPTAEERQHQSWLAAEERKAEEHRKKMALLDAKKEATTSQKSQGQPKNGLSNDAHTLVADAAEGKIKADLVEATQTKPKQSLPIGGTANPVPNTMPVGEPPAAPAPIAQAAVPTAESNAPAIPDQQVAAEAAAKSQRRTSEQVAAERAAKPFVSFRNAMVTNLGGNEHPEAARNALSVLKKEVFGGERVSLEKGKSHPGENWTKAKEYILANPDKFEKPVVDYIQKGAEKARAEASAKKAAKAAESQRGGINVNAVAEAGGNIAGAVKPVLSQTGALVGSELKGAAAMVPFMLATDVQAQNAGYRRELEQQLKTERNASRAAELQAEIQKLDENKYINALKRRYVDKNIPAQLRPQ